MFPRLVLPERQLNHLANSKYKNRNEVLHELCDPNNRREVLEAFLIWESPSNVESLLRLAGLLVLLLRM